MIIQNGRTFKITFTPAGASRSVTWFGEGDKNAFKRLRKNGADYKESKMKMINGVKTEVESTHYFIPGSNAKFVPQQMNLHYGELENAETEN